MVDLHFADSEQEADEQGLRWWQSLDPTAKVGSVHHTVPKFYLLRFARNEQVVTRTPGENRVILRNVADMGQRDFYTAVVDVELLRAVQDAETLTDAQREDLLAAATGEQRGADARFEDIFGHFEGLAATVLARLTATPTQPVDRNERYVLTEFLAFQMVRGVRSRREYELIGEFFAKSMLRPPLPAKARRRTELAQARLAGRHPARGNGRRLSPKRTERDRLLTDGQLAKVSIRPPPNEHLLMIAQAQERIGVHLFLRPFTVVELDQPLLVTGDEPVVVVAEPNAEHLPSCYLTAKQRRRRLQAAITAGREEHRETLHLYTTRPQAVATAEHVAMPIDPHRALVLGRINTDATAHLHLNGDAAREFADDLNSRIAAQAYLWVAAHPDHPTFADLVIPEPGPLVLACDGASPAEQTLARPPQPRATVRQRRADWDG